jgi:[NiFe] hydrogenase diaphorase moiety large subunit
LEKGAEWFSGIGTESSSGTKLLSISGDCTTPGVFEVPFGITVAEALEQAGGSDAAAVLVGGPSGQMVARTDFGRRICFDDLPTGGAFVVFGPGRDVIEVAAEYLDFFIDESCGYCTPCRVGNVLMRQRLGKILRGEGEPSDLIRLEELGKTVRTMSRCGLGQTSPNPVLTTLSNFRGEYQSRVRERADGTHPSFHIHAALAEATALAGRTSSHFTTHMGGNA